MLYKYCANSEYTKEMIENSTLFMAKASQFNDPYDCFARLDLDGDIDGWKQYVSTSSSYTLQEKEAILQVFKNDPQIFKNIMTKRFSEATIQDGILVSCFSQKYDNRLMWSHYAKNHTGIVLGFNVTEYDKQKYIEFKSGQLGTFVRNKYLPLFPVQYVDDITTYNPLITTKPELINLLCRKDKIWSYEEEIRLFKPFENNKQVFDLDNKVIKVIFLGAKMPIEDVLEYIALKKRSNGEYEIYKMEMNKYEYRLDNKRIA